MVHPSHIDPVHARPGSRAQVPHAAQRSRLSTSRPSTGRQTIGSTLCGACSCCRRTSSTRCTVMVNMITATARGAHTCLPRPPAMRSATPSSRAGSGLVSTHLAGCCTMLQHGASVVGHAAPLSPWLKDQLGLEEESERANGDRHYMRTAGGRVVTVAESWRRVGGAVQLVLRLCRFTHPHPVL